MNEDEINKEYENQIQKNPHIFIRAYQWSANHINYKFGAIAGVGAGAVVYYINSDYGIAQAAGAFGKQFLYNLFIGGYNMKLCEKITTSNLDNRIAWSLGTIVPTTVAFLITYSIHKLGGTPEAFYSSIWQVPLNAVSSGFFSYYFQRKARKKIESTSPN